MRFANKIASVTSGSAMGRASALRLPRAGATVVVADSNAAPAEQVAAAVINSGQDWTWAVDVVSPTDVV